MYMYVMALHGLLYYQIEITIVDNYNTQIFYNFDLVILIIYFMNVHKILSVIQEISIISLKLNDT